MSMPIKWERCDIDNTRAGSREKKDMIWLSPADKNKERFNKVSIAANLCEQIGLKAGDTIWLYRAGDTLMIRKEKSDFVVRANNGSKNAADGGSLALTNQNFVAQILMPQVSSEKKITVFDAWVVEGDILFRARRE